MAADEDEKRERVMRRLAEMLQGPAPETGGGGGVSGGIEEAIASLGLGLSEEDREEIAGAVREGPDPEEAAALFQAMLAGFREWKGRRPAGSGGAADEGDVPPAAEDPPQAP